MLSLFLLSLFYFFYIKYQAKKLNKYKNLSEDTEKDLFFRETLSWLFVVASLMLLFSPINVFYEFLGKHIFSKLYGIQFNFDWVSFFMYYGILVLLSLLAELIIALYYRFSNKPYPKQSGYGMWDYFLKEITPQKVILLLGLLSVASIIEEIVFRFTFFNILIHLQLQYSLLTILIISSVAFGLAHYQNGGWIYCVNSMMAGFVFGVAFIQLGMWFAWALHFAWNFLIVFQMFLPLIYGRKGTHQQSSNTYTFKFE
jgi:membrane protease YdiL (CAAX protease family)